MCEFCTEHGEGKAWYLEMKNYSQDLLSQDGRREHIRAFFTNFEARTARSLPMLDAVQAMPFVPEIVTQRVIANQKKTHFGQVVPLQDVDLILDGGPCRVGVHRDVVQAHLILLRLRRGALRIVRMPVVQRLALRGRSPLAGGRRRLRLDLHQVHAADRALTRFVAHHVRVHRAAIQRIGVLGRMLRRTVIGTLGGLLAREAHHQAELGAMVCPRRRNRGKASS